MGERPGAGGRWPSNAKSAPPLYLSVDGVRCAGEVPRARCPIDSGAHECIELGHPCRHFTAHVRPTQGTGAAHGIPTRVPVSYTHLRAHETRHDLVCRLLLEKK